MAEEKLSLDEMLGLAGRIQNWRQARYKENSKKTHYHGSVDEIVIGMTRTLGNVLVCVTKVNDDSEDAITIGEYNSGASDEEQVFQGLYKRVMEMAEMNENEKKDEALKYAREILRSVNKSR